MTGQDELDAKIEKLLREILTLKENTLKNNQELIDTSKQIQESTRSYIKSNPGKSMLITLGLGVLLGLLIRRK